MPIHGNKDSVAAGGTYNVTAAGAINIVGASGFPASVKPGDSVVVGANEYIVKTTVGATGLTVFVGDKGAAAEATVASGATIYFQEKPKHLMANNRSGVYGVDTTEAGVTPVTHAGWVKVTTGTGGRSGRVRRETLVAMSVPAATMGDAEDTAFPD